MQLRSGVDRLVIWPIRSQAQKRSSSPTPNSKAKTDGEGENPSKESGNRDESSSEIRSEIPCRCQNYKSKTGRTFGNKCYFRHVEADEKPRNKSKKSGNERISCLMESVQWGCVSQDSYPRKSVLHKPGNWERERTRREILQKHVAPNENSVNKSIARRHPKVCASRAQHARQNLG